MRALEPKATISIKNKIIFGSFFDLKHGSLMFCMFRKPVSVLDEKSNKTRFKTRVKKSILIHQMLANFIIHVIPR